MRTKFFLHLFVFYKIVMTYFSYLIHKIQKAQQLYGAQQVLSKTSNWLIMISFKLYSWGVMTSFLAVLPKKIFLMLSETWLTLKLLQTDKINLSNKS